MEFGIGNVILILGSLGFFIYGMKLMSEGIQRAAGAQLRSILRNMTRNRYLGVFTGFLNHGPGSILFRNNRDDGEFCKPLGYSRWLSRPV